MPYCQFRKVIDPFTLPISNVNLIIAETFGALIAYIGGVGSYTNFSFPLRLLSFLSSGPIRLSPDRWFFALRRILEMVDDLDFVWWRNL